MGDLTNNGDRKETYMMGIVFPHRTRRDMIYQRHDYGLVCKLGIWGKLACPVFRQTRVVKPITLTYLMVIHVRVCKSETI